MVLLSFNRAKKWQLRWSCFLKGRLFLTVWVRNSMRGLLESQWYAPLHMGGEKRQVFLSFCLVCTCNFRMNIFSDWIWSWWNHLPWWPGRVCYLYMYMYVMMVPSSDLLYLYCVFWLFILVLSLMCINFSNVTCYPVPQCSLTLKEIKLEATPCCLVCLSLPHPLQLLHFFSSFCSSSLHSSHVGDIVLFNIASDRRMGSKQPRRATNVKLHKMVEMNQGNQSREKVSVAQ